MRVIGQLIGMIRHLFWWPAMVGIVLVVGSAAAALWQTAKQAPQDTTFGDRWDRGFYLAASVKNAVVLVRAREADNMQLLLVDFESGKRTRLKSERSHLLSPYLSSDGARLMFSRRPLGQPAHELISCETATLVCHTILRSAGSIQSAIEISGGRVLYVSSPYVKGGDGRMRFNRRDIWLYDPVTGSRQLTDFKLSELHSLSVTDSEIYFSAFGASRQKPAIPAEGPNDTRQSDIFRLPFDAAKGTIELPSETMKPLFASPGIATRPSVSADGTLVAFLRTRTRANPYLYNLVIADQNTHAERLIETSDIGFSRPVVIDHDVYASLIKYDRVQIRVARPGEVSMSLLADIYDMSVANTETVELTIQP